MKCRQCGNEMYIDHVDKTEAVEKYIYVCVNPQCRDYRKAAALTGEEAQAEILPRTV